MIIIIMVIFINEFYDDFNHVGIASVKNVYIVFVHYYLTNIQMTLFSSFMKWCKTSVP